MKLALLVNSSGVFMRRDTTSGSNWRNPFRPVLPEGSHCCQWLLKIIKKTYL